MQKRQTLILVFAVYGLHFATAEVTVGRLEAIFRQFDFKPLVFGTFAEITTNAREFIETTVEYGVENLGRTMAATTVDTTVRTALRRRYTTQLAMAAWKGYTNLMLDMTKYVYNKYWLSNWNLSK